MQRSLSRLADERFDLLVIGGGITGASIARDAALRGLAVALIEKDDFSHATSAHNSKLIHGGLRYLRNLELGLVRESLRERRIWQRTAPHLVSPLPFLVPLYDTGWSAKATLAAGLSLYDLLSYDRGWLSDKNQRLPGHSVLTPQAALTREPKLEGPGFGGAFLYYDAQMYAPERLVLECLVSADTHGAVCANYVEATGLLLRNGTAEGVSARDAQSGTTFDIRAARTILAVGPWTDLFLERALEHPSSAKLIRSKGIHLIVPAMTANDALTVPTEHGHFFVLPWRGRTIIGTTDTAFTAAPDSVGVSERDIEGLLCVVNAHLPHADLRRSDVLHFYAGLRPLVADGSADTYGASRKAELIDHGAADGIAGLYSAIGGKWTTSRHLAEQIVDRLAPQLGKTVLPCSTAQMHLPGGWIDDIAGFLSQARAAHPELATDHLARLYGTRLHEVLAQARERLDLTTPLSPSGDIGAQVLYAVREEMALTLEDVAMRRTGIGQLGAPSADALDTVVRLMSDELGWDKTRQEAEISNLARNFKTCEDTA